MSHQVKNLLHIFGIGPLFLYVGLYRDTVPEYMFQLLGATGFIILGYHSYLAYTKLKENKSAWVNWIHIFLVAPLLLLLGYLKKDASRRYFEMLLLLGFSAIGYHALYLMREMMFD
jgi:hypothetical protein